AEIEQGINENQRILHSLSPFDLVLASTLIRTQQTAQHYRFYPETERLLDELDFGPFEGRPKEELLEILGDQWLENPKELVLGESIRHLE
ncbi:histidine phosphatase family protein, partial [Alkalihalophilus pseudofirmus]